MYIEHSSQDLYQSTGSHFACPFLNHSQVIASSPNSKTLPSSISQSRIPFPPTLSIDARKTIDCGNENTCKRNKNNDLVLIASRKDYRRRFLSPMERTSKKTRRWENISQELPVKILSMLVDVLSC